MCDWVSIINAAATSALAILALVIAVKQYKVSLYSKRLEIYTKIREFFGHVIGGAQADFQKQLSWYRSCDAAPFLFGNDIPEYVEEIWQKALRLQAIVDELNENNPSRPPAQSDERRILVREKRGLLEWFTKENCDLRKRFQAYLDLMKLL